MLLSLIFTITCDLLLQSESVAKFDLYYHLDDLLLQSESVAKFDLYYDL